MDTIFALASGSGRSGVAVIRISGPDAFEAARRLAGPTVSGRGMWYRHLKDSEGRILDDALVLGFQAPSSFTGEDVVEFQIHGSIATISAVTSELAKQSGLRQAEAGEFTRRALQNGRLDLAQVEGLADLIDAETEAQRIQAQRLLAGDLGRVADAWREHLIKAASLLEVTIDFADEDVPVDVSQEVSDLLAFVRQQIDAELSGVKISERIRNGFEVAIVGPPNAGKSTLLNRLAGRKAALTSEVAGTTRDVIEVRMDLDGLPVTFLDTAGLRDTDDVVEAMGIDLAKERAASADLRVVLKAGSDPLGLKLEPDDIVLTAKADEGGLDGVSGKTGAGVDELVLRITGIFANRVTSAGLATRDRHKDALQKAAEALGKADGLLEHGSDVYDLAAEEIRIAIRSLAFLVGRIDVESLLDEIFASFCLGK